MTSKGISLRFFVFLRKTVRNREKQFINFNNGKNNEQTNFNYMERNQLKHHFINLYLIALSDGNFDKEELGVILNIASEKGISEEEFKGFITDPTNVTPEIPDDFLSKIRLLYDFTRVILADGKIEEDERKVFMRLCNNYGFGEEESAELFEWLIGLAQKNLPTERIDEELQTLMD